MTPGWRRQGSHPSLYGGDTIVLQSDEHSGMSVGSPYLLPVPAAPLPPTGRADPLPIHPSHPSDWSGGASALYLIGRFCGVHDMRGLRFHTDTRRRLGVTRRKAESDRKHRNREDNERNSLHSHDSALLPLSTSANPLAFDPGRQKVLTTPWAIPDNLLLIGLRQSPSPGSAPGKALASPPSRAVGSGEGGSLRNIVAQRWRAPKGFAARSR